MKHFPSLSESDAQRAMPACYEKAQELKAAVTIAVVDATGTLLALFRMDGARAHTVDLAIRKARTSAATGVATAALKAHASAHADLMTLAGGLPWLDNLTPAGAVDISGATEEIDAAIAKAGIDAIGTEAMAA